MKNTIKTLLPCTVPQPLFVIACGLLLTLGAASWAAINSIANEADAGLAVLALPDPLAVAQIRDHNPTFSTTADLHALYRIFPHS
jgi:hypothetical protein